MEIKDLNIAWFTEGNWVGKIPRDHRNMRNDSAWMHVLNATHYCIFNVPDTRFNVPDIKFDLSIVTLPKKNITALIQLNSIEKIKKNSKKMIMMQEGPHWYFQDFSMAEQVWYYNILTEFDMIWAHNKKDASYYQGLTGVKTVINPTLMITERLSQNIVNRRELTIIGGNMVRWYGGFDSYIVAQTFGYPIYAPSMGRRIKQEEDLELIHIPFVDWLEWMRQLSQFSFGVHLMPTHAAGTFTLNCSFYGIPCIGYKGLDTQENCQPKLSVDDGDIATAIKLAKKLKEEESFRKECSEDAKENFNKSLYNEKNYVSYINNVINELFR